MLENKSNWDHRGESNYGIVVRCPSLVGNRLVYLDHNQKTDGWVIRDFLAGRKLNKVNSLLSIQDIEKDVDYDEFPPWLSVTDDAAKWQNYLKVRTYAVLRPHNDPFSNNDPFFTVPPNPAWEDL
jgi:hypothetical protein